MTQMVETACKSYIASEAITQYLRVKSSSGQAAIAGATDNDIGVADREAFAANEVIPVRLRTAQGTCKMVAAGAITQEAIVYGAAGGKISATVNSNPVGIALEAASDDNSVIEVIRMDAIEEMLGRTTPILGFREPATMPSSFGRTATPTITAL